MKYPVILSSIAIAVLLSAGLAAEPSSSLDREIEDFFHDAEFFDFRISTDGSCISYGEYRGKSRRSLMTVNFTKSERRGLEAAPGEDIYSRGWIGPDLLVYEKSMLGATRFNGVYSARALMHDIERLDTELRENRRVWPRVVHTMPHDPEVCAVIDRMGGGSFNDILYLNVADGQYVGRAKNPGRADRMYLDTRGQVRLARVRGESQGETIWKYRDNNGSEWVDLDPGDKVYDWRFFDDGLVAFAEVADGPRVFVQLYDFSKRAFVGSPIGSDSVDVTVDGFIHDPSNMGIYGIRIDETQPRIVWFDKGIAKLEGQLRKVFPGSLITVLGVNSVSNDLFFRVESDISPGAYYAIGAEGKVEQLGQVNSRLEGYKLPRTRGVQFENRDGQMIHGYLTVPELEEGKSAPLIVIAHGGPHSRDHWTYSASRQFLAYKGFATLTVNYRGSSGYGKAFWEQDGFASILERSVSDVIDATRWAQTQSGVDPERAAIMGGSFGGYIAVEAVRREPELYRCSIGFAGVYDWPKQLRASRRNNPSGWDWHLGGEFGDKKEYEEQYDALSPINDLGPIKVPILLMHGKADDVVENVQSRGLHKALQRLGKESELVLDNWGLHGFIDEERRVEYYGRVYQFLVEHLR